jgi:hypothetical protein
MKSLTSFLILFLTAGWMASCGSDDGSVEMPEESEPLRRKVW